MCNNKQGCYFLFLLWFFPILIGAITGRLRLYGLEWAVGFLLAISVGLGILYVFLYMYKKPASIHVTLVIFVLYSAMLLSDVTEVKLVGVLAAYSVIVHLLAKAYPDVLWKQYYFVCVVLAWMTIIDFISYLAIREFIFSHRIPETIIYSIPRVTPVFDEMSHQAFFIMPAAIMAYSRSKNFFLLSVGVLLPFSAAAIIIFMPLFLYFNWSCFSQSKSNLYGLLVVITLFAVILFYSSEFVMGRLSIVLDTDLLHNAVKKGSAQNIIISFDLLRNISVLDALKGFGFFGPADNFHSLLYDSEFFNYYFVTGVFDRDVKAVGLVNLIMYFGMALMIFVSFLLFRARRNAVDELLYSVSIVVVIASMLKNSHTVDHFVHLFFVFGLAWSGVWSTGINKSYHDVKFIS